MGKHEPCRISAEPYICPAVGVSCFKTGHAILNPQDAASARYLRERETNRRDISGAGEQFDQSGGLGKRGRCESIIASGNRTGA